MYIVKWKNKKTGQTGQGSPVNKKAAIEWVDLMNEDYPDIHHWIEPAAAPAPVPSDENEVKNGH